MKKRISGLIEHVIRSETGSAKRPVFSFILLMLSRVYLAGVKLRIVLYRTAVFRSEKLPCFVVSIGNIVAGGTGKTPMTMYVAETIAGFGYKTVVVSRGYRGRCGKSGCVVSDGRTVFLSVKTAGDEAYMIAGNTQVPVVVGKDKLKAGMLAVKTFPPDVIVFDDASQHLALKRDLDLLLCDYAKPFGNGELLPRGVLREPPASAARSDAVIYTRSDRRSAVPMSHRLKKGKKELPVFKTFHKPVFCRIVTRKSCWKADVGQMKEKRVFLVSSIADNTDFKKTCERIGMVVKGCLEFPDHHWYTSADLADIVLQFQKGASEFIVTTEKDYVKIENQMTADIPIAVVCVRIQFEDNAGERFNAYIKNRMERYFDRQDDTQG